MRAELTKWRLLPLARWTAVAVLAAVVLTGGLLDIFPREDGDGFIGLMSSVTDLFMEVAAIVLGAWAATLEFSSGTLQRTLTAQADRNRVLAAKLAVLILGVALLGLAAAAAGGGLVDAATTQHGVDLDRGELAQAMFANIPGPIAVAILSFGLGLLTRSLGGAITIALGFVFVLTGILTFLPELKRFMYGTFESDMTSRLAGATALPGTDMHSLPVAVLGVLAWIVVLLVPGWLRFCRADLK